MDPYKREILNRGSEDRWEPVRQALGDTRRFADRMDLEAMKPAGELSSTAFCLANPGHEYLVFQPQAGEAFTLDLKPATYRVEWFDPLKHASEQGEVEGSIAQQRFTAPFPGQAVLYLRAVR